MTSFSASDLAGRRLRHLRERRKWTAKELADRCARLGAPHITSTVITNLETRRRATREITLDEVLVLAEVLDVPPIQFMTPLDAAEELEVVPGVSMDALAAVAWLAGEPPSDLLALIDAQFPGPGITERLLAQRSNAVTTVRQIGIVTDSIIRWDEAAQDPELHENDPHRIEVYAKDIAAMADRLMHLAARMETLGYAPPGLGAVRKILERRELPSTLREWQQRAAESAVRYRGADRRRMPDG